MRCAIVDYRISETETYNLENLGYRVLKCPHCSDVYEGISGHPDIQLYVSSQKSIVAQKKLSPDFIKDLNQTGYNINLSHKALSLKYPEDIILNAFSTKDFFIHNTNFTDNEVLNLEKNKEVIHVNQGYTKCSILPVTDKAVITNDNSIFKALTTHGFDVLLLPYGDIMLPGFNYGFIGGCGGNTQTGELLFFGDLNHYKYGAEVISFLLKYSVEPVYLYNGPLRDRGSLILL
ncbi:DUF6873 family GME fold protein [Clostridium polynesiense]|uniref:DUF6873 family GME fold protein n=1 Tax=Clostridium polynesiense TaxID=1325933 RepID=UPI00058E8F6B|nr:hypothetical protein [Clostridium polynesiense]